LVSPAISSPAFAALIAAALAATVIDIRTRRIPNELTAALTGVGVGLAITGVSGLTVWGSIAGCAIGLALMIPGHVLGATGAGDVKLMAAVGSVVGPKTVVTAFLFTAIAGGVLAVVVAKRRGRLAATIAGTGRLMTTGTDAHEQIRSAPQAHRFAYGPAIAIGSVLATLVK
jgi:prepilin peptidase CpaA